MFDKENYRKRREAGLRGQGAEFDPIGATLTQGRYSTVNLGVKKFKRDNTPRNPKHKRLIGHVYSDLKAEAWDVFTKPKPIKKAKAKKKVAK